MNIGNLQIEAMKTMLSGDRPVKCCVDGDRVLFTTDGYTGWSIPVKYVYLDLNKIPVYKQLKGLFSLSDKDVPVKVTKVLVKGPDGLLVRLKSETFDVFVKKSFFDKYGKEATAAYCESPISPVKFVGLVNDVVESIILPVQVGEGWMK